MSKQKIVVPRILNLKKILKSKSYILLGPRQTGKTMLIKQQFPNAKMYNLLLLEDYKKLSFDPTLIRKELKANDKFIIIDEIQRIPELLDEVHYLIEEKNINFLLTGSSARKLKKQSTNLLGGRARLLRLHPLVAEELGEHFNLDRVIQYGLLPSIYFSDDPDADLDAYIGLYLEQEIANEGASRNLHAFSRFLEVASLFNGEQVDYTSVSNDAQIPRTTIHEYFKILEETLIGYLLPCFGETKKRKPIATAKFYFFDWGLVRKLQGLGKISIKSEIFGKAFETYIFHEIKTFCDYHNIKDLHYWRTQQKDEVDFIINKKVAVEVKSGSVFKKEFIKSLVQLRDENVVESYYIIYGGKDLFLEQYPWLNVVNYRTFISKLYRGEISII